MLEEVYKVESSKVLATLIKLLGDFDLAEDALQEAFLIATEDWSAKGIPKNPYSWLVSVGRNKAVDKIRKEKRGSELFRKLEIVEKYDFEEKIEQVDDDQLRLIFLCCHTLIPLDSRIALSLKEVCGLKIEQISKAFLCEPETIRKRIYRAKKLIKQENIPFHFPEKSLLKDRVNSVLHVIYLIFNEGYSIGKCEETFKTGLMNEAIYFTELLNRLMPSSETMGLLSLFSFQKSRTYTRLNQNGKLIALKDQKRELWDRSLIDEGLKYLEQAIMSGSMGPYCLQAAIASIHSTAKSFEETKWDLIVGYYDMLLSLNPSPVIELNRAVAVGYLEGPMVALEIVNKLESEKLENFQILVSIKAEFLSQSGQIEEAKKYFKKAVNLSDNDKEKSFLNQRLRDIS